MEDRRVVALIVIMGIVIVGLGGYIAYEKFFVKDDNNSKTVIDNVSVDLNYFYQIGETLERLDSAFNDEHSIYYGYAYNQKKMEVSSMDSALALYTTIQKDMVGSATERFLIGADVRQEFENIYGKSLTYSPDSLELGTGYSVYYEPITQNFSYVAPIANNIYRSGYKPINIKTVLTEDSVIITRKVFYVEYGGNSEGGVDMTKAFIYKSPDKNSLIGEVQLKNGIINLKEVIGKFGSKINTYEYTFKLEKDDTYSFYSIELKK